MACSLVSRAIGPAGVIPWVAVRLKPALTLIKDGPALAARRLPCDPVRQRKGRPGVMPRRP